MASLTSIGESKHELSNTLQLLDPFATASLPTAGRKIPTTEKNAYLQFSERGNKPADIPQNTAIPWTQAVATHRCDTGWEPTAEILARFYNPVDDPAMFHNFGQCPPSDVIDVFADSELSDLSDDEATDDDSDYDVTAESISVPVKRKRKATSTPRKTATRSSNATAHHTATASSKLLPGRKKKGARTMAQRRAVLEADPWTITVAPHHVVCRAASTPSSSTGAPCIIRVSGRSTANAARK
ncbi:hypothetical protein B0H14DRAFT_3861015 [Mycena olivaceomarginata]|nr:hypothetical protein B0H14DRAFT_3861015 [Mycena olivaceomarginata]